MRKKNKKFLIMISIMLIIVFMMSLALVACKKTQAPDNPGNPSLGSGEPDPGDGGGDDDPPIIINPPQKDPEYAKSFRGAVGYMVEAMPSDYLSIDFNGNATLSGKRYKMSLKGNLSKDDMEIAATFVTEDTGKTVFAFYIVNSKLFFELEDGTIFNVAEINVNYLLSIIDKLPDKIGDLLGQHTDTVVLVLDILLSGMTPRSNIVYSNNDGVESFKLGMDIQGFLNPITGLLDPSNPLVGPLLSSFLPENLDLTIVNDLLSLVPLINGQLVATVDHGVLSEFNLELYNNDSDDKENYGNTLIGIDNKITFSAKPLDISFPEGVSNDYEVWTLGNLNADFTLDIDTGDKAFDIGALIDTFLPKPIFGKDVVLLDGNADYSLEVKVSLDPNLDGLAEDNNYINLVLKVGENELVRANYLDGVIYIKAIANGINGFADGGINVAIPLDLKGYIEQLVNIVTKAIDGFLGTQFKPELSTTAILSASINERGDVIISPSVQDAIMSVLGFVDTLLLKDGNSFADCVEITENGDKVTLSIGEKLFRAIFSLINKDSQDEDKDSEDVDIDSISKDNNSEEEKDWLGALIDANIFGGLVVGLNKSGVEYVEVNAMNVLTLRADSFLIGTAKTSRQDVLDSIGNLNDYSTDIEGIMLNFALSLLSDLELSFDLDLSTIDTTVNLTTIINNIMALANSSTYLKLPIALDLSEYDGTFKLRVASNFDQETRVGRMLLELYTPDGDTLISAYNEDSRTYIDLTGLGFVKFCLTNVNLSQIIRGALGEDITEDALYEVAPTMMNSPFTSKVEIDSDSVGVAVNSYLVTMIMRMLTMDLGMDIGLNDASLNFDGSVDVELGIGNTASIGLSMALGKESETKYRIESVINDLKKPEYSDYSAVDAEMLLNSIFAGLMRDGFELKLDLYNNNVDNPSHENKTRLVIRNSYAGSPGKSEELDNGLKAPYGSIVIAAYAGWANNQALLYGYLDILNLNEYEYSKSGKLEIKLAPTALNGLTIVGFGAGDLKNTIVNAFTIPIDLDLKGTLINLLDGLFGDASQNDGSYGGAIDVPEGALPPQKPHKCSHVCPTCGKCLDKDCKQGSCAAKCEAVDGVHPTPEEPTESEPTPPIEKIIPGITLALTGTMGIDVDMNINGDYVSNMLFDLLNDLFMDLDLSSMKAGKVSFPYNNTDKGVFATNLYNKVVLPIIKGQVSNFVGGLIDTASNVETVVKNLVMRFLPISYVEDIKVNLSLTDGKLADLTAIGSNKDSERGFGIYLFNKFADSAVSWEDQATNIYFNPIIETEEDALMSKFVKRARKHVASNWEEDGWQDIVWTLKDSELKLADFNANLDDYDDGDYVFTGYAWNTQISVNLTLHRSKIKNVKDMEVKAMRDIPDYVTAVFEDDTERLITNVDIQLYEGRSNSEKNASVVIGEEKYDFTINFEKEEISLDTLVLNAYDYLDVINSLEDSGVARVKINDTFYRNLPATYDFKDIETGKNIKAMSRQELQKPATYQVKVHVGEGTVYDRDMQLAVEFTPFDIYSIEFEGHRYIETDFIEAAKGEGFPSQITVIGFNGKEELKYTADVSEWNIDGVTIDLKGGQYFASAVINKGDYNAWTLYGIEVRVLSTDLVGLANSSKTVTFDWKYFLYGNVPDTNVMPTLLDFKTSDGTIKKNVPVTIDVSGFFDAKNPNKINQLIRDTMQNGKTFTCPVSVDVKNDGKSLFKDVVQVYVPSVKMSLIEDEIVISYDDYMRFGKSAFFRDKIEIKLGDDVVTAHVTWFTDDVVFNKYGTYTAIVYLDYNGDYEQSCEVSVRITDAPATQEV